MIKSFLAIGNGEKCPYCEIVITEDIDTVEHFLKYHEDQVLNHLLDSDEYDK